MNSIFRRCLNVIGYMAKALSSDLYWFKRSVRYSMLYRGEEYLSNRLLVISHSIEKGITMPNRRLGFGQGNVRMMTMLCKEYIKKYGSTASQLQIALDVLSEYLDIHVSAAYLLPTDIVTSIKELLFYKTWPDISCQEETKETYFTLGDFYSFAHSRHSCRWFGDGEVPKQKIIDVIELANTAPSACNRQSIRVICVSGDKKDACLSLQNGNRGFGEKINKLLIVTFRQPSWEYDIQSAGFFDAGIYTMNILYALHYYQLCACTLNCHLDKKNLKKLQKVLSLNPCEVPTVFIGIGLPPEKMRIAKSERIKVNDILTFIES